MNIAQLLKYVIYPVIDHMGFDKTLEQKKNSAALLIYTCQQESNGGQYIHQVGGGPALGIMQMEPFTFNDILNNYVKYRPSIKSDLERLCDPTGLTPEQTIWNLALSVAMARVHYRRSPLANPRFDDREGMWKIYKSHYNSQLGAATREEFFRSIDKVFKYL